MSDTEFTPDTTPPFADADAARLPRPRIRIGALIWGLVLIALSSAVLWMASSPSRRAAALEALIDLGPFGWAVLGLIALGVVITLIAFAAVIRRLQKRGR